MSPPQGRAEATRAQILDAALAQFSTYGFARTSMSRIAHASTVSRTSLYKHFKTKEDVFSALSERINGEVLAAVRAAACEPGPAEERLPAVMDAWVGWAFELLQRSPHGRELIDEKNRLCADTSADANARFESLVTALLADGIVDESSATRLAPILISAVKGLVLTEDVARDMRPKVRELVDVFVRGVRSAPG